MATYKLVDQAGVWITNLRLSVSDVKAGDRIPRGLDTLEVLDVKVGEDGDDKPILVVRPREVSRSY